MNQEELWNNLMSWIEGLEKMSSYVSTNNHSQKRREKQMESLKTLLVINAQKMFEEGQIVDKIETYEDVLNSKSLNEWLVKNAPEGFEVGKDSVYRNPNALNQRKVAERELKMSGMKVDDNFVKTYIKSCGYESIDDMPKESFKYIAQQQGVATCVAEEKAKEYFKKSLER